MIKTEIALEELIEKAEKAVLMPNLNWVLGIGLAIGLKKI